MQLVRLLLVALIVVLHTACASAGRSPSELGLAAWEQAVAEQAIAAGEPVYPYAVSPEMQAWVTGFERRFGRMAPEAKLRQLQEVLFDPDAFPFTYDERHTATAAEAFASRSGNCMSFTSLFIALSRAMGLETFLVAVSRPPEIEKQDDLVVVNRHVVAGHVVSGQLHLYDFYITTEVPYMSRRMIDDVSASAMYHSNLGGAAIRGGDLGEARRQLEVAVQLDPGLASAWVNLGVARSRSGDRDGALEAYQRALHASPGHASALTNMAYLYQQQGLDEQARTSLLAASEGRSTPFTLIALADAELVRGNVDQARGYLFRARRSYSREPAVYDALARLERQRGDPLRASQYARRAAKLRARQLPES
jgi:Flp pilus assembly protein TadD